MTRSHVSSLMSTTLAGRLVPALLTRMSIRPNRSVAAGHRLLDLAAHG